MSAEWKDVTRQSNRSTQAFELNVGDLRLHVAKLIDCSSWFLWSYGVGDLNLSAYQLTSDDLVCAQAEAVGFVRQMIKQKIARLTAALEELP